MSQYCFAAFTLFATSISFATGSTPIDQYSTDDTLVVAVVDVQRLADESLLTELLSVGGLKVDDLGAEAADQIALARRQVADLGITQVYVAATAQDAIGRRPPIVVARFADAGAARTGSAALTTLLNGAKCTVAGADETSVVIDWDSGKNSMPIAERADLLGPLSGFEESGDLLRVVLSASDNVRRVARDLAPTQLQDEVRLLTDDARHAVVAMQRAESLQLRLTLQATDSSAAEELAALVKRALSSTAALCRSKAPEFAPIVTSAVESLEVARDEASVEVEVDSRDTKLRTLVSDAAMPTLRRLREQTRNQSKMNDMKQLGLAMHNFENVHGFFPSSIVDKEGTPLLSWRVAILPYLEQGEVLRRFHLDEPWDSPHNLKVAKKSLPSVYFQSTDDSRLKEEARTCYLRPIYEGSDAADRTKSDGPVAAREEGKALYYARGEAFRNITDGTSNTIMIAEVAPEHAVLWTKPADWEVDLDDPMAKLRTNERSGFVNAFYDGSARHMPFDTDPELLKKLITKAGREVIKW